MSRGKLGLADISDALSGYLFYTSQTVYVIICYIYRVTLMRRIIIETGQQIRMLEHSLHSLLNQRDVVMRSIVSADRRIPRLQKGCASLV